MIVGYDPARIARLKTLSTAAIDDLTRLHCADPAADGAVGALARMRSVLEDGFMPAVVDIEHSDPLVRAYAGRALEGVPRPEDNAWYSQWLDSVLGPTERPDEPFRGTQYSDLDSVDLLTIAGALFRTQLESHAKPMPAPDDPFWTDVLPELADEFAHRAATDPEFARTMIAEAEYEPIIGYIVAEGEFDDDVVLAVLSSLTFGEASVARDGGYRADAVSNLMESIAAEPALASAVLHDAKLSTALFTWDHTEFRPGVLDQNALAGVVISGLIVAPEVQVPHPGTIGALSPKDTALSSIENIVDIAQLPYFDKGFSPSVGQALAFVIVAYQGEFMRGSEDQGTIEVFADGPEAIHIGSRDEVTVLLGGVMHDDSARATLGSILHSANDAAARGDPGYSNLDVSKFSVLLNESLAGENLEFENDRLGRIAVIEAYTEIADQAAKAVLSAADGGVFSKFVASTAIDAGGDYLAGRVGADTIGAVDYAAANDIVMRLAIIRAHVLDPGRHVGRPTTGNVDAASRALDSIEQKFADGTSSFSDIEDAVNRAERTLEEVVDLAAIDLEVQLNTYHPRQIDPASDPADPDDAFPGSN